jgi:quercetin dioxygenase-like cupin family protein
MAQQHQPPNKLRPVTRFITDHDIEGLAIFNKDVTARTIRTGDSFYLAYTATKVPTDLATDLAAYKQHLANDPVYTVPGGTALSVIDLVPGSNGPMHRTLSLDYAVVLEGAVELILDSGEATTLQRGDIAIQRGTIHQWRNVSETEWARMLFVLQESRPVEVAGKTLEQEFRFE